VLVAQLHAYNRLLAPTVGSSAVLYSVFRFCQQFNLFDDAENKGMAGAFLSGAS
jgi:hypothetical protein